MKLSGIILTCILNLLLCYALLWNPYSLYFDRPELSQTPFELRERYAALAIAINIALLIGTTAWMVIRYWKAQRFVIWAPVCSVLTLILVLYVQRDLPNGQSEYTKDGYRYLEQSWYSDQEPIIKRYRSAQPDSFYKDYRNIVWILDSTSEIK